MDNSSLKNRHCVVTGAGGFIGSHLVEALLARGAYVKALVHYNAHGSIGNLESVRQTSPNFENLAIVAGDVRDARCMRNLIDGAQVVFHLAALIGIPYSYVAPESYVDTNMRGTLNVLEACRDLGVERILHTSTSEAYGSARYTPMDERHPLQAQSPYSASKIAADKLAESYILSFDLPAVTVRPFNTYGPRQSCRGVIPTIISQALREEYPEIRLGSLDPVRDLTFAEDTARAFCEIAEAPLERVNGRLYNLGTGDGVSVGDLAARIQGIIGCDKAIAADESRLRPAASEVRALISDPSRIQSEVGWKAAYSLDEGLAKTIEWFRANPPSLEAASRYVI